MTSSSNYKNARTRLWAILGCLVISFSALANAEELKPEVEILGQWHYYKKIYRGVDMPVGPESKLRLFFEFFPDGTDRLYWWHEGEGDYCERRGEYKIEFPLLVDKIVWVNPKNTFQCSRDPDMQLGKIAKTPISFSNGDFLLHLPLGDETLIYVWRKIASGN